jgi:hypothetical protein
LLEVSLDEHLADATTLHLGADGYGVYTNGTSSLLMADISALAAKVPPVLGEVHVTVGDDVATAPR